MAKTGQRFKVKRLGFYEGRKSKFAIKTFFKCVMRVADFALACVVMVIAMLAKFIHQMAHGMERMAKYGGQYRRSD